jgi:hypothetical protein
MGQNYDIKPDWIDGCLGNKCYTKQKVHLY